MYDRAYQVGRMGFEVQYRLLADPRFLKFDRNAKKLGTKFDEGRCGLEEPLPKRWSLVADPSRGSLYVPDKDQLPGPASRYFLTDHHTRFKDSVGYQTYRTYPENKRVVFQLELVSQPVDQSYSRRRFIKDAHRLYHKNIAELLDLGVVSIFPGKEDKQQGIQEQLNLELDDESWGRHRVDPMRKLACLGLGMWVLTRYRDQLDLDEDEHLYLLLDHFHEDLLFNQRWPLRYDILSNTRLLMEGWLHGAPGPQRLTWRWLKTFLTSRAHVMLLTQCLDNNFSAYYVHGMQRLTARELRRLSPRDLLMLRQLGIDSMFLECFAMEPEEHLDADAVERYNIPFLRKALGQFCDIDELVRVVRGCVLGEGRVPDDASILMPLFHLRKTINPGCTYMELRTIHKVKNRKHKRYPYRYQLVKGRRARARIIQMDHLWKLGRDCAELFEVAMAAGRAVLERVEADDWRLRRRRVRALDEVLAPMARYLVHNYARPNWG